jgi:hypothetical protein
MRVAIDGERLAAITARFREDIAGYSTAQIEAMVRDELRQQTRRLRRRHRKALEAPEGSPAAK